MKTPTLTLVAAMMLAAGTTLACDMDLGTNGKHEAHGHGSDSHGGHAAMTVKGDQGPASLAYHQANVTMHKGMDLTFSGDTDIDFLKGMIAHHQGAVDMAQVQLKYGNNAQLKRLSRDIIRAQNLEIRWMNTWLAQLEANKKGYQDSAWSGDSHLYQ